MAAHSREIHPSTGRQPVQCALWHLLDDVGAQVQLLGPGLGVSAPPTTRWQPGRVPCPLPLGPSVSAPLRAMASCAKDPSDTRKPCHDSSEPHRTQAQRVPPSTGDHAAQRGHEPCAGTPSGSRTVLEAQFWAPGRSGQAEERPFGAQALWVYRQNSPPWAALPAGLAGVGRRSSLSATALPLVASGLPAHLQGGWQAGRDGPQPVPVQPQVEQAA